MKVKKKEEIRAQGGSRKTKKNEFIKNFTFSGWTLTSHLRGSNRHLRASCNYFDIVQELFMNIKSMILLMLDNISTKNIAILKSVEFLCSIYSHVFINDRSSSKRFPFVLIECSSIHKSVFMFRILQMIAGCHEDESIVWFLLLLMPKYSFGI